MCRHGRVGTAGEATADDRATSVYWGNIRAMTDAPVRLLLIDDEPSISEPLAEYLATHGFSVATAAHAADARAQLLGDRFDLAICDVMMPGEDGLSLTRFMRETLALPVILLTARSEETERVVGLEIGADDYVVKPFSPRELVARIRAVLRRAGAEPVDADPALQGESFRFENWLLSTTTRALDHVDGRTVTLSTGEYQLLLALVRHPRQVMTRDRLLDLVRGREADIFDRAIDNLISRLRRKIEDDAKQPHLIKTVWGGGYTFAATVRRAGRAGRD